MWQHSTQKHTQLAKILKSDLEGSPPADVWDSMSPCSAGKLGAGRKRCLIFSLGEESADLCLIQGLTHGPKLWKQWPCTRAASDLCGRCTARCEPARYGQVRVAVQIATDFAADFLGEAGPSVDQLRQLTAASVFCCLPCRTPLRCLAD